MKTFQQKCANHQILRKSYFSELRMTKILQLEAKFPWFSRRCHQRPWRVRILALWSHGSQCFSVKLWSWGTWDCIGIVQLTSLVLWRSPWQVIPFSLKINKNWADFGTFCGTCSIFYTHIHTHTHTHTHTRTHAHTHTRTHTHRYIYIYFFFPQLRHPWIWMSCSNVGDESLQHCFVLLVSLGCSSKMFNYVWMSFGTRIVYDRRMENP